MEPQGRSRPSSTGYGDIRASPGFRFAQPGLRVPTQPFAQRAAHDPIEVIDAQEIELLGKIRNALAVAAMREHAGEVGPPIAAPRAERLDHPLEWCVQISEGIRLARKA